MRLKERGGEREKKKRTMEEIYGACCRDKISVLLSSGERGQRGGGGGVGCMGGES